MFIYLTAELIQHILVEIMLKKHLLIEVAKELNKFAMLCV